MPWPFFSPTVKSMADPIASPRLPAIMYPPSLCEYSNGPCDQTFKDAQHSDGLFLYPSEPEVIAVTIEEAAKLLQSTAGYVLAGPRQWRTWKEIGAQGQIIFCRICKAMRFAGLIVADVTTLNFNLMFEIGYALGLGVPVLPIRDTTYVEDDKLFAQVGMIDILGYVDFQNSSELAGTVMRRLNQEPVFPQPPAINREQPIFLMKSHLQNEGSVRLMSALKKSGLRFRSFDPREAPRLSLHEAFKQVHSSLGVIVHSVSPARIGSVVHNSRCALVAGMAMAAGKRVLMLQEVDSRSDQKQPIDYRDVVRLYSNPKAIPDLLIPLVKNVVGELQGSKFVPTALPLTPLEKIDLGDLAAENEIVSLSSYFVPTAQFNEAKRGHARLVIGRKGAGKTAIFYGIRSTHKPSWSNLVLDLKPEGHQFTKLREAVLQQLTPGLQQHVLTAFWNYLLLMEIAHKIIQEEGSRSYRDRKQREAFKGVESAYSAYRTGETEQGDFSERLLALVDEIVARNARLDVSKSTESVTELVYTRDIRALSDALAEYLAAARKEHIWLLFDNLDKGWPILEAKPADILLVKSLLEATRKLQRQFEKRGAESHAVVFLRNDIYDHLILDPADRGKETPVVLDWSDPEVFKEIVRRRVALSTGLDAKFEELWLFFFTSHVRGQESFSYILDRTLSRPRELLRFIRDSIDVAVNRGHETVQEQDILHAEASYSDDALVDLTLELKDVSPHFSNVPYAFIDSAATLPVGQVEELIASAGVQAEDIGRVLELLLWFGFLGIHVYPDEERYAYQYQHNLRKMRSGLSSFSYCVHPAFRRALSSKEG
jgi:hypothetical protein